MDQLLTPETQALILQTLAALTVLMPVLEWAAAKTKNKIDDKVVAFILKVLNLVPRLRTGGQK